MKIKTTIVFYLLLIATIQVSTGLAHSKQHADIFAFLEMDETGNFKNQKL